MGALVLIPMRKVRELHAQGWTCKAIAAHLGIAYHTLNKRTARMGIRFPRSRFPRQRA